MEHFNLPDEKVLYQTIIEINEPMLFKNVLQNLEGEYAWKLFEWNMVELVDKFGDARLPFRIGYNARSMNPQWEQNASTIPMRLSELIREIDITEDNTKWYYFDYKYMQDWFEDKPEIINSITWKRFGIDKNGADSTIWIGSKGAHTNCHQDSYGCNLVAQIHGRKQWLLFPPNSSKFLRPTRIPYEESTVYSKYNFFCPTEDDERNILEIQDKARSVTLEPGDVLFVPPGWWHYVESLDLTVSVNIWLPIESDHESRVKEAIVKLIITGIGENICDLIDLTDCTLSECINLLNVALKQCTEIKNAPSSSKKMKYTVTTATELAARYSVCVKLLQELETTELKKLLKMKRERFPEDSIRLLKDSPSKPGVVSFKNSVSPIQRLSKDVVNCLCHPDVVNKVAELLLS